MATVELFAPVNMDDVNVSPGEVVKATATRIVVSDGFDTTVYLGKGFTYDESGLTGGTWTGLEASENDVLEARVTGLSVDALTAANLIELGDIQSLFKVALGKVDTVTGSAGDDLVRSFAAADTVNGSGGSDTVFGGAGNDRLLGGGGSDQLTGSAGKDTLTGGTGKDSFRFTNIHDSPLAAPDVITDFNEVHTDRIDLSLIGSFSYIGTEDFSALGQVRYFQNHGDTFVEVNTSGTLAPDLRIELLGLHMLDDADFLLGGWH